MPKKDNDEFDIFINDLMFRIENDSLPLLSKTDFRNYLIGDISDTDKARIEKQLLSSGESVYRYVLYKRFIFEQLIVFFSGSQVQRYLSSFISSHYKLTKLEKEKVEELVEENFSKEEKLFFRKLDFGFAFEEKLKLYETLTLNFCIALKKIKKNIGRMRNLEQLIINFEKTLIKYSIPADISKQFFLFIFREVVNYEKIK